MQQSKYLDPKLCKSEIPMVEHKKKSGNPHTYCNFKPFASATKNEISYVDLVHLSISKLGLRFEWFFFFLRKWAQGKFSFGLNCDLLSIIGLLALTDEYQGRQRRTCNLCMILKSMASLRQAPQKQCMCNKCRTQEKILFSCEIFNR